MSDQESRREDFVRGDHDVPQTISVLVQVRFVVNQASSDDETILAEENVTAQLEQLMEDNSDIVEFEIIDTEVD